ncbi:hypothetical protein ASD11_09725 [Aeromicrobium sp. Root495]|uniref:STAS domain-containing protein n=1 Tax=Aeromicrobium sp. Root495 TaxID=1736550 RepID=UPI0006F6E23C|nr:STAS domain-containing protein [Aeromicrobium sp. Root495]KQY59799.1 hypothetical protein ASD11_09725 [Aeromicrobium sp. Root495]RYJ07340.1 MAG: anti-sigma factor antagonist [Actinomycetales bacterium]
MSDLTFGSDVQEDRTVLTVAGEIDMQSAVSLRAQVDHLDIGGGTLVLDLEGVGFVDSSGLGALLGIKKQQDRSGGRLQLGAISPPVQRIFEITKMLHVFERAEA